MTDFIFRLGIGVSLVCAPLVLTAWLVKIQAEAGEITVFFEPGVFMEAAVTGWGLGVAAMFGSALWHILTQ